jgi:hypothetical protein
MSIRWELACLGIAAFGCGTAPAGTVDGSDCTGSACVPSGCAYTACVSALPARLDTTTVDSSLVSFDHYSCDPSALLTGREAVIRVAVPEDGFLEVAKTAQSAPGTVLRLLGTLDPMNCLDGHATNVASRVTAGEVFVVVDSAPGAEGNVSLQIALTTAHSFEAAGIQSDLARDALTVIENAWAWGATRRSEYVVVDFSLHDAMRREWVFDLSTNELLWNLRVAHGWSSTDGTNLAMAIKFSNVNGSNQSSLGLLRSAGTYIGEFGESFRLEGLEPGFNDHVCDRAIVMHPWSPIGDEYVNRCGFARPSLGCPAIDSEIAKPIRDRLANPEPATLEKGVAMLYWYPGTDWQQSSVFLHGTSATPALETAMSAQCDSSYNHPMPSQPPSTAYPCN